MNMATRANIAIKENGKYKYIYNHCDSYIDDLGITLYKYFNDAEAAKTLVELGNTDSIYNTLENTATSYREHLDRPSEKRGTVAHFRESKKWNDFCNYEVDWEECKPIETENISEILTEEFTYIFDIEANKWLVAYDNDQYQIRDLEEVLHSKELLKKIFSIMYQDEYLPQFYKKCLNA